MASDDKSETYVVAYGAFLDGVENCEEVFSSKREARSFIKNNIGGGTPYTLHKVVVYKLEHGVA